MDRYTARLVVDVLDLAQEERRLTWEDEDGEFWNSSEAVSKFLLACVDRREHPEKYPLWGYLQTLDYDDAARIESAMLYGRGDFGTYESAYRYVDRSWGRQRDKESAVDYVYGKDLSALAEYMLSALTRGRDIA